MGKQSATLRQRSSAATTATIAPEQQQYKSEEELTTWDKVNFYVAQYIGMVFCAAGIAVLACGYDKGWMHNTALCWVCLVLNLVGLFFHEFRPFNVSHGSNASSMCQIDPVFLHQQLLRSVLHFVNVHAVAPAAHARLASAWQHTEAVASLFHSPAAAAHLLGRCPSRETRGPAGGTASR